MITVLLVLLAILVVLILLLCCTGIGIICWPLLVTLLSGLIIDICTLKKIFKSKKEKDVEIEITIED